MPDLVTAAAAFHEAIDAAIASGACVPAFAAELHARLDLLLGAMSVALLHAIWKGDRALDAADRVVDAAERMRKELGFADLRFEALKVLHAGVASPSAVAASLPSLN